MKRVPLAAVVIGGTTLPAADVLAQLVKAPAPGQGFNLGEMRDRIKVLDKLDAAKKTGFVDLEDAEHATLLGALNASSFSLADRGLLDLIDGCMNAAATPIGP